MGLFGKKDKFLDIEKKYFDADYYKKTYPEVAKEKDLFKHFREKGWKKGLNPNEWFLVNDYLEYNPDVATSQIEPFYHYLKFGLKEGRRIDDLQNSKQTKLSRKILKEPSLIYPQTKPLKTNKVLIIADMCISQCKLYRVDAKVIQLEKLGYEVDCFSWEYQLNNINSMQTAELVIFYRVPYIKQIELYFKEARRLGLKIIYDIDDLIFDEEIYAEALKNYEIPESLKEHLLSDAKLYAKSLTLSDEVWVSTQVLCDIVRQKYHKNCNIVPNGINNILEEYILNDEQYFRNVEEKDTVDIFYGAGSNTHDADLRLILPTLERILAEFSNVHLYLIGDLQKIQFKESIKNQLHIIDRVSYDDYYYLISKFDIALIPLEKSIFNEAKSNLKFIEASMLGLVSIASNVIEFSSVINDGVNGYLASDESEWYAKLKQLVQSKELRKQLLKQAKIDVTKKYSYDTIANNISADLKNNELLPSKNKTNRKSLLVVNVLYGVSSFGGATVVAEALAENTTKFSDYDVTVFTTHSDAHLPEGLLKRYQWKGIEVISVNVKGVTVAYSNKDLEDIFDMVLQTINPSIVHFHCIQTIGLETAEMCLLRNIPYVVTIHDGWWRCNRQFLLDSSSKYCGDEKLSCDLCKNRCSVKHKIFYTRLHKCEKVLNGADIVYTPSNFFTDFSKKDFPNAVIKTNSNGIIDCLLNANDKKETKDKKLVFGYLGGKDKVKGFHYVQQILNKKDSSKFSLLLIDTAKKGECSGLYKKTDFSCDLDIRGYTPHEEMKDIYSSIDVLLFPSNWKESFGLVVREAIANNVFVIASRCGGPSDAIVHGENGFVFDFGSIDMFEKYVDDVLANIDYYKKYKTTNFGDVRSFAEQAKELVADYDSIMKKRNLTKSDITYSPSTNKGIK